MLKRNISGEEFIGIRQRFDPDVASALANRIRSHGTNARVIDSAGKKRIYLGNRKYRKRFKEIRGKKPFDPRYDNTMNSRSVAPDVMGSYDPSNKIRTRQYIDWKINAYKNAPDLRYVAIGVAQVENRRDPNTGMWGQFPTSKQPYLLSIGLVPSNIATMHLASLGFDIANGPINQWYTEDKDLRDEAWHQTNIKNFEYHLNKQGLKPTTKREMFENFMGIGKTGYAFDSDDTIQKYSYIPVYKVGPSDIASKQDALEIDKGFSELFDFDDGQRLRRLSDFMPLIHFYMTEDEIQDWISNVNSRAKGIQFDRNQSRSISYRATQKSLYREPLEDIYDKSLKPDYGKVLEPVQYEAINRLITDDFTYDFINLQRAGWGAERKSDRRDPDEEFVFLPYFNPKSIPFDGGFRPMRYMPLDPKAMTDEDWNEWMAGSEWWDNKIQNAEITMTAYEEWRGNNDGSVVDFMRQMPILDMGEASNNKMEEIIKAKALVDKISMAMNEFPITYSIADGTGAPVDITGEWSAESDWVPAPYPSWSQLNTGGNEPLPALPSKADLMRALD